MDEPTEDFIQSMLGRNVAVTLTNDFILHGVLLKNANLGVVLGIGKFKNPRAVTKDMILKMYPMGGDDREHAPGMVRSTKS